MPVSRRSPRFNANQGVRFAIEIQTKAVEKAQGDPEMLGDLMEALDQYKAEAGAAKPG